MFPEVDFPVNPAYTRTLPEVKIGGPEVAILRPAGDGLTGGRQPIYE
jgi:hypothetical protein